MSFDQIVQQLVLEMPALVISLLALRGLFGLFRDLLTHMKSRDQQQTELVIWLVKRLAGEQAPMPPSIKIQTESAPPLPR